MAEKATKQNVWKACDDLQASGISPTSTKLLKIFPTAGKSDLCKNLKAWRKENEGLEVVIDEPVPDELKKESSDKINDLVSEIWAKAYYLVEKKITDDFTKYETDAVEDLSNKLKAKELEAQHLLGQIDAKNKEIERLTELNSSLNQRLTDFKNEADRATTDSKCMEQSMFRLLEIKGAMNEESVKRLVQFIENPDIIGQVTKLSKQQKQLKGA